MMMRSILFTLLLFLPFPSLGQSASGRVVGIADGDTITILTDAKKQVKVRINGINAPERGQAFGEASKENLSRLVFGRVVTVESDKRDRYGRTVGKVLVQGLDVGLTQLREGMAWHYKNYEREQSPEDRRTYAGAETEARRTRRGLWIDATPLPPWEYRHPERAQSKEKSSTPLPRAAVGVPILGNKNSRVYHRPDCPDYNRISPGNRVSFHTIREAEAAGYRRARNCQAPTSAK